LAKLVLGIFDVYALILHIHHRLIFCAIDRFAIKIGADL